MNIQEADVLIHLSDAPFTNQRALSDATGYSLGTVNQAVKALTKSGMLDDNCFLTAKAKQTISKHSPVNAVILAAGFGMRMVPINHISPKAFLEVRGEYLIERQIRQLAEKNITDITIVVGYMKESFDYLIDKYRHDCSITLIVNKDYSSRNNLHSLALAADRISNTYIVPCDLWAEQNPFKTKELYSWYMLSDNDKTASGVRANRKREMVRTSDNTAGSRMIGIAYINSEDAELLRQSLITKDRDPGYNERYWEEALFTGDRSRVSAKIVPDSSVIEINTYEQLRSLDDSSNSADSDVMKTIAAALDCSEEDIKDINILKKGMTNRSFIFTVSGGRSGSRFIMRIPGEGTDKLINRANEAKVYDAIKGQGFCDEPVYINPNNGYKITRYLDSVRVCDASNEEDLQRCMAKLKEFHDRDIKVGHTFDIFGQIDFYESLMGGIKSGYRDYDTTKANVLSLKDYIDSTRTRWCLTHIDAVPDNFLFYKRDNADNEELQLTDWEYSGMQDPYVDLAMFSIYSYYTKEEIDHLISIYFGKDAEDDTPATRARIYAYVAACGLLWSNWTEYKSTLGVEFGEYGLKQYRYAKDFYEYAKEAISKL